MSTPFREKNVQVIVWLSPDFIAEVSQYMTEKHLTNRSDLIRVALTEYIERTRSKPKMESD